MTQLRCPYPEPRRMPRLNDRVVQPDEVVDVPAELVAGFRAAGWVEPGERVAWPPGAAEPSDPPATATSSTTGDGDQAAATGEPVAPPAPAGDQTATAASSTTRTTTNRRR